MYRRRLYILLQPEGSDTAARIFRAVHHLMVAAGIAIMLTATVTAMADAHGPFLEIGFYVVATFFLIEYGLRLIAAPETEGLPVMRRWHVVHTQAKTLSPPAEAFRYFMLENGEACLAQHFRQGNELVAENAAAQE